jgi:UDP-2,3-diacylglucosamine pyrophosphatase LpxH
MRYFIVSDLHLSMGRDVNGLLHPLEDFDSDQRFEELLALALRQGAELIINGDWLDFLQLEPLSPLGDYRSAEGIPLGWTALESQKKLETCFARHALHFSQLAEFLRAKGHVTVLQGNHDADLFFPADLSSDEPPLQHMVRQKLRNPDQEALRFVATSVRLGSAHVEHGHQRCEPMNAFQNHPSIFHPDRSSALLGRLRLELLWGSRFVLEFFNKLEEHYPFADNLKTTTRALILGIKSGWVKSQTAVDFLRFFCGAGVPWKDVPEVLEPPAGPLGLIQGLKDEELMSVFLQRMASDDLFRRELTQLLEASSKPETGGLRVHERSEMGSEEWLGRDDTLGVIRKPRELREAQRVLKQGGTTAVIFGHTHQEIDGADRDAPVKNYFNTGTWTPRFDLRTAANRKLLREARFPIEVLSDPKKFELRLMYADVSVEDGTTQVALKELSG